MEVKVLESLSAIPPPIARQFSFPTVQNFFLSLDWFACLYATSLRLSMTPRVYCLLDHDQSPVAMLYCATKKGEKTLYSLTNFYTIEFGPISVLSPNSTSQLIDRIVEHIESERPRWRAIDFRFMLSSDHGNIDIQEAFERRGFSVSTYFMYENWYANTLGKSFETFYASLSSRLRNTIKRKEKKLKKLYSTKTEIYADKGLGRDRAIDDYISIYNKSWKREEPFPDFMPELILTTSKLGILRLGILYIDDKPAASQVWINANGKALIYKLAYNEDFSDFSPGSILSREMFRHALDVDKAEEIDYGVGSESYKKDWMSSVRKIEGMQAYNKKTANGLSLSVYRAAKLLARQLVKP